MTKGKLLQREVCRKVNTNELSISSLSSKEVLKELLKENQSIRLLNSNKIPICTDFPQMETK